MYGYCWHSIGFRRQCWAALAAVLVAGSWSVRLRASAGHGLRILPLVLSARHPDQFYFADEFPLWAFIAFWLVHVLRRGFQLFFVSWFVRAHCEASCSGCYTCREVSTPGEVNSMGAEFLVGIGLVIFGGVVARRHFRAGLTVALIGGALFLLVIFG